MCQDCHVDAAIELADLALERLESFKTDQRAKAYDMRDWMSRERHVTQPMVGVLERLANAQLEQMGAYGARQLPTAAQASQSLAAIPHVLIAPNKYETDERIRDALVAVAAQALKSITITNANKLDWDEVAAVEGGKERAYKWCAKTFDACVLLENGEGFLGRGAFSIAREFMAIGKPVGVVRDGRVQRCRVSINDPGDWKTYYGRVELAQ